MMEAVSDTIAAVATPPGRGGIGVIRVSGELSRTVSEVLLKTVLQPKRAHYGYFYDGSGERLDQGIALFFQGPYSFTGEDVLELHCHGSPIVLDNLLRVMLGLGVRLASPGEFSKRAFLNDKIDLSQAEAISDLINASSKEAARLAIRSLEGEFSRCISDLVEQIVHLRMYVEAAIDFSEEDIDFLSDQKVFDQLEGVLASLAQVMKASKQGSVLQEGLTVVIAGKPNMGKSSLLNRLSGRDSAIVTEVAGTTRDVIREHILIDQVPFCVFDTAGLQETEDVVEREGVRRAWASVEKADHVLLVHDASFSLSEMPENLRSIGEEVPLTVIRNKIDLTGECPGMSQCDGYSVVSVSAKTGEGFDLLRGHLRRLVDQTEQTEGAFLARRRHLDALERANTFLHLARELLRENRSYELVAEEFRQAQLALSEITGEFTTDDLLDKIFSSFCVGK